MDTRIIDSGINEIKYVANDIINKVDVNELLEIAMAYLKQEKSIEDIEKEYGPKYKEAVIAYASQYGKDKVELLIKKLLENSNDEKINKLANDDYSKELVNSSLDVIQDVKSYFNGEIDEKQLMIKIANSDLTSTINTLLVAKGLNVEEIIRNIEQFKQAPIAAATFACLMEAYEIYMKCLNEASIQHEHRLIIEERCNESIKLIKSYREEMEKNMAHYFEKKYDVFEMGIDAMREAILKNDSDGYIAGNIEIQKILNYNSQFKNQKEFNDLMDSDIEFKL